jgi:hypothetical protein
MALYCLCDAGPYRFFRASRASRAEGLRIGPKRRMQAQKPPRKGPEAATGIRASLALRGRLSLVSEPFSPIANPTARNARKSHTAESSQYPAPVWADERVDWDNAAALQVGARAGFGNGAIAERGVADVVGVNQAISLQQSIVDLVVEPLAAGDERLIVGPRQRQQVDLARVGLAQGAVVAHRETGDAPAAPSQPTAPSSRAPSDAAAG